MVKEYESVSLFNSRESLILESIPHNHSVIIFSKSELLSLFVLHARNRKGQIKKNRPIMLEILFCSLFRLICLSQDALQVGWHDVWEH